MPAADVIDGHVSTFSHVMPASDVIDGPVSTVSHMMPASDFVGQLSTGSDVFPSDVSTVSHVAAPEMTGLASSQTFSSEPLSVSIPSTEHVSVSHMMPTESVTFPGTVHHVHHITSVVHKSHDPVHVTVHH